MTSRSNLEEYSPSGGESGLFKGMSFWLSQNVPQRSRFKEIIQQNGGIIKLVEKDADIQLVDHKRKNLPPNTFSYQYVEHSVRKGKLRDLEAYRAGPSAARAVGATHIPARGHRLPYTLEDDQTLWDWMQPYETDRTAGIAGNKIYQELEAKHPRHTYQSYRDRYLKRLRGLPRPGGLAESTASRSILEENSRRSPSHTPTPQRNEVSSLRTDEASQKPADRKRKRSPQPAVSQVNESGKSHNSELEGTTTQNSPQILTQLAARVEQGKHKESEATPKSKRTKSTAEPPTEKAAPQEPVDSLFLELPFLPSISSESEEDAPEQDIDTWIDNHLRPGSGINEEQIIEALRCTSMDPDLADKVLDSFAEGNGIPNDMRGVWTPQDDECVDAKETRDIQRVLEKHGSDLFNSRWEYLTMARTAGLEKSVAN